MIVGSQNLAWSRDLPTARSLVQQSWFVNTFTEGSATFVVASYRGNSIHPNR